MSDVREEQILMRVCVCVVCVCVPHLVVGSTRLAKRVPQAQTHC